MLRVRFFAAIRERLGRDALELPYGAACGDVAALVAALDAGPLPGCAATLLADNTIVAINRTVAGATSALSDGDEIAFFPPVTGG